MSSAWRSKRNFSKRDLLAHKGQKRDTINTLLLLILTLKGALSTLPCSFLLRYNHRIYIYCSGLPLDSAVGQLHDEDVTRSFIF